jgi:acyl-coenzyme A thioesterase PaaI-like protein
MIIDPKVLQSIPNSENQTCFGCGANNPHGLKMKFSTDGERVYSFMRAPDAMTGWDQTVHGGILSTMLDEVMGWGVVYLLKRIGMTNSITVQFNKAVFAGERLTVVGGIQEQQSDRESLMQGAVFNEKDTLCVEATGQFTTIRPKAALRLGLVGSDYMVTFGPILGFNYDGVGPNKP